MDPLEVTSTGRDMHVYGETSNIQGAQRIDLTAATSLSNTEMKSMDVETPNHTIPNVSEVIFVSKINNLKRFIQVSN